MDPIYGSCELGEEDVDSAELASNHIHGEGGNIHMVSHGGPGGVESTCMRK